ncbi:MAG: salt stress protein, Slr1339 family [Pseudanabaenaceae cyanobacterium]
MAEEQEIDQILGELAQSKSASSSSGEDLWNSQKSKPVSDPLQAILEEVKSGNNSVEASLSHEVKAIPTTEIYRELLSASQSLQPEQNSQHLPLDSISGELKTGESALDSSLLSELGSAPTPPKSTDPLHAILAEIKSSKLTVDSNLFSEVKITPSGNIWSELQSGSRVVELKARKEQERIGELRRQERQAKAWLEKLDRLSSDGIWFERFARNYSSELEAAIVYLFSDTK